MKINSLPRKTQAFTLIEMIGVLAVIAILAALLIPKVFQAITEARINTVPVGASTCKTATVDHYAKYNGLNLQWGTNTLTTPYTNYDGSVLLVEGFIDKPFAPQVGSAADILLDAISSGETTVTETEGRTYWLSGQGTSTNEVKGSHVVYARIDGVPIADAQAISARIDGNALSETEGATTADGRGRVKYDPTTNNTATVFIYLTHR